MQVFIVVAATILGLIIQYFIIKLAVVNGTQETFNSIDKYNHSQMRKAVKEGILEAMKVGDSQFTAELRDTIAAAIKKAADEAESPVSNYN